MLRRIVFFLLMLITFSAVGAQIPITLSSADLNTDIRTWTSGSSYSSYMNGAQTFGGITFNMQTNGSGKNVIWATNTNVFSIGSTNYSKTVTLNTSLYGATTVYTLINLAYHNVGSNVGSVTFSASDGTSHSVNLVVGTNVRDHYGANTVSASYVTTNVQGTNSGAHLDMQAFSLPSIFATKTLKSIIFTATGSTATGIPFLAGVTVDAPAQNIAYYAMDESAWNGTVNETKDTAEYSGGPFDGQGIGSPEPSATSTAPAISGTNGTCGYATFSGSSNGGSAFTLDSLPVSTSNGAKTSVSFWMYWNGTDGEMPIGWNEYDLWFAGSTFGFNTNNSDVYGMSSTGLANGWHHVVAIFTNGSVTSNKLYVDGVNTTLTQLAGSPNNTKAVVQSTLQIGGFTGNTSWRFTGGHIDEVKVYNGEITQAQVTVDYTATHACTGMPNLLANYHFEESAWTGATGEVKDASGNNYHAKVDKTTATARAVTEDVTTNRFISANPGTCGYGVFGSAGASYPIVLPSSFPNLTGSFTFATWYIELSTPTTARRIFADDYNESAGGFIFSDSDGGSGKLRFAKRSPMAGTTDKILDSSYVMTSGTKYFIAVSVDATNQTATIYVFDTSGTLLNKTTGAMGYFGASNIGNMTIGGAQASSGNTYLNHARMDEVNIYNRALSQAEILALLQTNHTCVGTNTAAANFNCVVTGGSADTGRLYTQLSTTGFNIDVVALKADRTTETSFVTSGTKNVTLEWLSGANSTCTTGTVLTPSTTVTFSTTDSGRKSVSIPAFNKAYRDLRCRVTDANQTPALNGCSSDNFAVRPPSFSSISATANADSAGISAFLTPAIKTGTNFSITADTAVSGYDGTPSIDSTKLNAHAGAIQKGIISGSFSTNNSTTGTTTGSTFTYSEVGYFNLAAYGVYDSSFTAVDSANGDCTTGFSASGGINACSFGNTTTTDYFGRFTPDHFEISNISSPAQCNSFNYYGQDFPTSFKLTAKNQPSLNTTTKNYTGAYAKLGLTTWESPLGKGYNFSAAGLPAGASLISGSTAPTGSWLSGETTTITANHKIGRLSNPMLPATITINAIPTDSDNVTTAATVLANKPFKYGRIFYPNTFGSELLPLTVPIQVQYWSGLAYLVNIEDSCTVLSNANFGMATYKGNLSGSPLCETALLPVVSTGLGIYAAILSAPGWGNTGSVDLTLFTNNTAVGNTCISPIPTAATKRNYPWFGTPVAKRATFGIFKSPVIYMHENF